MVNLPVCICGGLLAVGLISKGGGELVLLRTAASQLQSSWDSLMPQATRQRCFAEEMRSVTVTGVGERHRAFERAEALCGIQVE